MLVGQTESVFFFRISFDLIVSSLTFDVQSAMVTSGWTFFFLSANQS